MHLSTSSTYNQGLDSNKWAYFKSESSNSLKEYIFGMCKLRGIFWYVIYANWMLKIWPHLTFEWPFVNISLTIHPIHSKLYIFWDPYNLTSNLIYMKGHLKHFEIVTPTWPLRDPYWEGAKSSKILSKYFLTYNDFKTINNSFSSKRHLSTSSTSLQIKPNIHELMLCTNDEIV